MVFEAGWYIACVIKGDRYASPHFLRDLLGQTSLSCNSVPSKYILLDIVKCFGKWWWSGLKVAWFIIFPTLWLKMSPLVYPSRCVLFRDLMGRFFFSWLDFKNEILLLYFVLELELPCILGCVECSLTPLYLCFCSSLCYSISPITYPGPY